MKNTQMEKEKVSIQPRLLNNMQRKELIEIVKARFQSLIDEARKRSEGEHETAVEHARKELGFHLLKKRIDQVKAEQVDLEHKISELGFDSNGNLRTSYESKSNSYVPVASKARRLLEGKTSDSVKDLEKEREELVTKILLAETTSEARQLVKV